MGNVIFIKDRSVCVKPVRSRLEAIQKLHPSTIPKRCRSFVGMLNFFKHVLPRITKTITAEI